MHGCAPIRSSQPASPCLRCCALDVPRFQHRLFHTYHQLIICPRSTTTMPPVKKEREEKKPYSRPDKVCEPSQHSEVSIRDYYLTPQPARKEWTEEE